jgi:hypothetical protein
VFDFSEENEWPAWIGIRLNGDCAFNNHNCSADDFCGCNQYDGYEPDWYHEDCRVLGITNSTGPAPPPELRETYYYNTARKVCRLLGFDDYSYVNPYGSYMPTDGKIYWNSQESQWFVGSNDAAGAESFNKLECVRCTRDCSRVPHTACAPGEIWGWYGNNTSEQCYGISDKCCQCYSPFQQEGGDEPEPPDCIDDNLGMYPFDCDSAIATFGCEFLWTGWPEGSWEVDVPIGAICPYSCGECVDMPPCNEGSVELWGGCYNIATTEILINHGGNRSGGSVPVRPPPPPSSPSPPPDLFPPWLIKISVVAIL